ARRAPPQRGRAPRTAPAWPRAAAPERGRAGEGHAFCGAP
ncbi:hypothetical protein HMPREF0731_0204, partial [Pseudoroseomonas cervicalis ATCC 49957]